MQNQMSQFLEEKRWKHSKVFWVHTSWQKKIQTLFFNRMKKINICGVKSGS